MKLFLILGLLAQILPLFLYSQGFEVIHPTENDNFPGPIIELENGEFLVINNVIDHEDFYSTPLGVMVYKVSSTGIFLDSLWITNDDYYISGCFQVIKTGSTYAAFASAIYNNNTEAKGYIFHFDENLDSFTETIFTLPGSGNRIQSAYIDNDQNYYCAGTYGSVGTTDGIFVVKLNESGNILGSMQLPEYGIYVDFIFLDQLNAFHLLSMYKVTQVEKDLSSQLIWEVPFLSGYAGFWPDSKIVSDSEYVTLAPTWRLEISGSGDKTYMADALWFRNLTGQLTDSAFFYQKDTNNQSGMYCFDFKTQDSIFIGSYSNADEYQSFWGIPQDYWITVCNMNRNNHINWVATLGTDSAKYRIHSLTATRDGGCILAGLRYDWRNLYPVLKDDLYIAKLDKYGNSVNAIGENPATPAGLMIYPNPAIDRFRISGTHGNGMLLIYDLSGREHARFPIKKDDSSVTLPNLSNGMYFCQIKENTGKIRSCKLLISR